MKIISICYNELRNNSVVECLPLLYIERRFLIYGKERFFNLNLTYYYHLINSFTLHYLEVVSPINKNDTHLQG